MEGIAWVQHPPYSSRFLPFLPFLYKHVFPFSNKINAKHLAHALGSIPGLATIFQKKAKEGNRLRREQFTFYRSYYEAMKDLSVEECAKLLLAIAAYALNEEEPELSGSCSACFKLIRPTLDSGRNKAANRMNVEEQIEIKPKSNSNKAKTNQNKPEQAEIKSEQTETNRKEREKERESEKEKERE